MIDNIIYEGVTNTPSYETQDVTSSPAYKVAYSMYVAVGGDPTVNFETVEDVYAALNVEYSKGNNRVTIESLSLDIIENGEYNYDNEEITGYRPVNVKVEVPQKYTDEQVENIRVEAENNGYNNGYGVGMNDGYNNGYGVGYAEGDAAGQQTGYTTGYGEGFTQGETEGYNDGYAEGLDDGAEDQKALLEDITITENGVYEKEDGYKKVTVEMSAVPSGEGFDFSVLGYDTDEANLLNNKTANDIEYSQQLYEEYNNRPSSNKSYWTLYKNDTKLVYAPKLQYCKDSALQMFYGCSALEFVPNINFSNVDNLEDAFRECSSLRNISLNLPNATKISGILSKCAKLENVELNTSDALVELSKYEDGSASPFYDCKALKNVKISNTSNVTCFGGLFYNCSNLVDAPMLDTSNVTTMKRMFYNCTYLKSVPAYDTSKVTDMSNMFYSCSSLTTVPAFDTSKVTNMEYFINYCQQLTSLPQLDFSSVNNMTYFVGYSNNTSLTDLGGFINLGAQSTLTGINTSYAFNKLPNLTHDSLMNVINNLYDRATAGLSILTLKLHANHLAMLTDDEKAIATNKGWTIS